MKRYEELDKKIDEFNFKLANLQGSVTRLQNTQFHLENEIEKQKKFLLKFQTLVAQGIKIGDIDFATLLEYYY